MSWMRRKNNQKHKKIRLGTPKHSEGKVQVEAFDLKLGKQQPDVCHAELGPRHPKSLDPKNAHVDPNGSKAPKCTLKVPK